MERQSSVNDVHKLVSQAYPELYKTLCKQLGDDNPFAKFGIGNGYYSWSDNRCQWKQMVDASDFEKSIISDAMFSLKERITAKLGKKSTDVLFTYPDDSYVYYNDDNGEIKILITGWGFKKPVRGTGFGDKVHIRKSNPITLSFSYDGVRQAGYKFGIQTAKQVKQLITDQNGLFSFSNLKVGEHYILTDISSGKKYNLDILEGESHYDYDITEYINCVVNVTLDAEPLAAEPVTVSYNGRACEATTDRDGKAVFELPLYEGVSVSASVRDQQQNETMSTEGLKYDFAFENEKPEEKTKVRVIVKEYAAPVASMSVSINYGEQVLAGVTDINGVYDAELTYNESDFCCVSVRGYDSQSKALRLNTVNEFNFDKEKKNEPDPPVTLTPPAPEVLLPRIRVEYPDGKIASNYPISVKIDDISSSYTTNNYGIVYLTEQPVGVHFQVTDGKNVDYTEEYVVESGKDEYLFVVPEITVEDIRFIKVMFRDLNGNPIVCDNVTFSQEGCSDIAVSLNEDGDAYFEPGIFKLDETITVTINGWKDNKYSPIDFTMVEDEYEYLFEEKPSTTSSSWWMRILEVLAVIAAAILLIYPLWPFFEGCCDAMFNYIYG